MKKAVKRKPEKKRAQRTPKPDASQLALAAVERAIGGKLGDGIPKKR
jgi:hypothetical protein